jgi:hypothetical protein
MRRRLYLNNLVSTAEKELPGNRFRQVVDELMEAA